MAKRRLAFWREYVRTRADVVEHELSLYAEPSMDEHKAVHQHLRMAREAIGVREPDSEPSPRWRRVSDWLANDLMWRRRIIDWWVGASIASAFLNLHAAEVMLARLLPPEEIEARIPNVLAHLEALGETDARWLAATAELRDPPGTTAPNRGAALCNAMRTAYDLSDLQHARVHSFRNILFVATGMVAMLVVLLCVLAWSDPTALPLCFDQRGSQGTAQARQDGLACPGGNSQQAPGDVTLVALMGLAGGTLSATVALRKLRGTSTPYAVPVALSLLKLPLGALTSVIGILLVQGGFVPGLSDLDNQGQILAYAVVFGFAQQVATRLVDQKGQEVLNRVPSTEPALPAPRGSALRADAAG